jgi:hypothetical protein
MMMPTLAEIKAAVQALTAEAEATRAHAEHITRQAKYARELSQTASAIEAAGSVRLEGLTFSQPGAVATVVAFLRSQATVALEGVSLVAPTPPTE